MNVGMSRVESVILLTSNFAGTGASVSHAVCALMFAKKKQEIISKMFFTNGNYAKCSDCLAVCGLSILSVRA
jgi:hypothetical protein